MEAIAVLCVIAAAALAGGQAADDEGLGLGLGLGLGRRLTMGALEVPAVADVREDAVLRCRFDPGSERLYSVKWYKDEFEFFRFMPDNAPPAQTFPVDGVRLKEEECSMDSVTLTNLSLASSGTYRCEVSTEAPNFDTLFKNANMTVMALPQDDPLIEGVRSSYAVGDTVRANCTAAPSYPPAVLEWFINGIKAERWLLDQMPLTQDGLSRNSHTEQSDPWPGGNGNGGIGQDTSATPVMTPEQRLTASMPLRSEPSPASPPSPWGPGGPGLESRSRGLRFATERRFFQPPSDAMVIACVARVGGRERRRAVTSTLLAPAPATHPLGASPRRRYNAGSVLTPYSSTVGVLVSLILSMMAS